MKTKANPSAYIAALLEVSMVAVFASDQSYPGIALWLAYFHFSATRALLFDLFI